MPTNRPSQTVVQQTTAVPRCSPGPGAASRARGHGMRMEGPAGAGGPEQGGTRVQLPADSGGSGQAGGAGCSDQGVGTTTCLRAGQATDITAFLSAHRHDHRDTQTAGQGHPGTCHAPRPAHGGTGQGVGNFNL